MCFPMWTIKTFGRSVEEEKGSTPPHLTAICFRIRGLFLQIRYCICYWFYVFLNHALTNINVTNNFIIRQFWCISSISSSKKGKNWKLTILQIIYNFLCTVRCILYYTLFIVLYTVNCSVHFSLYCTLHCTVHCVLYCTLYIYCSLYSILYIYCSLYIVLYTVYFPAHCTLFCTIFFVMNTVYL